MIIVKPYPHPDDWMKEDSNEPLQEMPSSPDKIYKDLTQYGGALVEHLFKLFYFREFGEYFNNWSNSVYKCAFRVSKLSSPPRFKNKPPPVDMIYEWMWGRWEDTIDIQHDGFLKNVNNKSNPEYQHLPYIHAGGDEKSAGSFIKDYHLWLARELSKKGKIALGDVREEIKLLFRKYPNRTRQ